MGCLYTRVVDSLVIPARFNGPPDSGHGGYSCGVVAGLLRGQVEVELRAPPPLETEMEVRRYGDTVEVLSGETLVVRARKRGPLELELEEPVDVETAREASDLERWARNHPFPTCYACGPKRDDGMCEYPGPVAGRDVFACTWTPVEGEHTPLFVWAALDCPTSAPVATWPAGAPVVLARLAVRQDRDVQVGRPHVVVSWKLGEDGRKKHAAAALYDEDGGLCAFAKALWIELRSTGGRR
jgi:hypothetical protein